MTLHLRAGIALACALILAAPPALAQKTVSQPGPSVPQSAIGYGAPGSAAEAVTEANGLPVNCVNGCSGSGSATLSPFSAVGNATLSVTASTARVALPTADDTVVLQNLGAVAVYLKFGDVTVEAATTDTPLQPGMVMVFNGGASTHVAAITGAGAATLAVTTGTGTPTFGLALDPAAVTPVNLAAQTTGGCTLHSVQSAASTNATNVKNAAGTLCGGVLINTTSTLYYLRLYNLASAPTCSSATGFVATIPIPASTSGAGTLINLGSYGGAFGTGVSYCLTGGPTSTDNTNAATGVIGALSYK